MHTLQRRIRMLEAVIPLARCHTCGQALQCPRCEGTASPAVLAGIRERLQRRLEEMAQRQHALSEKDEVDGS
jgi:primosomal protein N'